jgi:hypothetical protein
MSENLLPIHIAACTALFFRSASKNLNHLVLISFFVARAGAGAVSIRIPIECGRVQPPTARRT